MHIAEVVTIAKSLPLLRLNTYKSLILSYSADYRRIFKKKIQLYHKIPKEFGLKITKFLLFLSVLSQNSILFSLRHHIIPYSLYFFNLSFYPISEKRCTFAAQFMKDRNLVIQKHY